MSDKIVPLQHLLSVPGIRLEKRALVFEANVSDREMAATLAGLAQLNESLTFWRGDAYLKLVEMRATGEGIDRAKKPERFDQLEIETIANYADMLNLPKDEVINVERTMAFFPHAARRDALSFAHHKEAFAAADGDLLKANSWLDMAEEKKWTVVQLRAFIRKDLARDKALEADASVRETSDDEIDVKLEELKLWATKRQRELPKMTREKARAMLAALQPLVALIEELVRRAGPPQGAQGR